MLIGRMHNGFLQSTDGEIYGMDGGREIFYEQLTGNFEIPLH